MRRRALLALALVLALLAAAGLARREEIARLLAVNALFDEDRIVWNFSHMGTMFDTVPMPSPPHAPSPLPAAATPIALPADVEDWIARRNVTGLVVLRRGEIVHEEYRLGTAPDDLRISWSVAKSFLAALLGTVLEEGAIASLDDPVTRYAPRLAGSAYDGATIRDVLMMSSGVAFNEDYLDFWSDINRMGRALALGRSLDDFATDLHETIAPPGTEFHYVSIDTHVLGMVIRGATGRRIPELMNARILTPLGLERDPYYLADGHGNAFVLGGLNLTTRDYARFGEMILQGGRWQGRQIVPADWVREMTTEAAPFRPDMKARYALHWWLPRDARPGEVFAEGIYSQFIWIDRAAGVVIAMNAADRAFEEPGVHDEIIAMLRRITEIAR
ncbi:MAG: class C beta-lactamase-related serine hydrolase [Alphaproteobacteria bacterium]|nr:MAG: class C beta-lactamase-related serine hydrolase [Alphaproteobacteria bacterium]